MNDERPRRSSRSDSDSRRRSYFGRSRWEKTQAESFDRSVIGRNPPSLARLREIVDRGQRGFDWSEIAIIIGSFLLVASVIATLFLALNINARANKIITNENTRALQGQDTVKEFADTAARIEKNIADLKEEIQRIPIVRIAVIPPTTISSIPKSPSTSTTIKKSATTSTSVNRPIQSPSSSPITTVTNGVASLLCVLLGALLCQGG